jgi:hypothetical protein
MFMEPNDYDEIPLRKILYFVTGVGLLAEKISWGRTIDQKMVAMQGSPYEHTPLLFILIFRRSQVLVYKAGHRKLTLVLKKQAIHYLQKFTYSLKAK